jgi:hypothetical protein
MSTDAVLAEITKDEDGTIHAVLKGRVISVLPDGASKVFRRRAIKGVGSPKARQVEWIVAELDGVRVYVQGDHIVMTKRDLNP